jgi:hypothetical protein
MLVAWPVQGGGDAAGAMDSMSRPITACAHCATLATSSIRSSSWCGRHSANQPIHVA